MPRLLLFGATGSLGRHVLGQALAAGFDVTAPVRTPAKLPADVRERVAVRQADLATVAPAEIARCAGGHDAVVNCAGLVTEGQAFVDLVGRLVDGLEALPAGARPACWFLAGAALLDLDATGRRGVELPKVRSTYWPHAANFERLRRTALDWRVLCPGPMVEQPALGLARMRVSIDRLPAAMPAIARRLPGPLVLPFFASVIPQMIVPYADAAALIVAPLGRDDAMSRHRVGLALPAGMRGHKDQWAARPKTSS
ncbi:MAG: NAD(P)H-binding protein [Burkholderiaceae bacterium]